MENGEKLRVRIVHSLEVGMLGVEVAIQAVSIYLAVNFHHPSKGLSITTTIFGGLNPLLENGRGWRLKVKDLLLEAVIE